MATKNIDSKDYTTRTCLHLDNSSERIVAKDAMVEGDRALEPARYHFLMVSTTFAFSITYFESSFPSKDTTICTINNHGPCH